MANSEVAVVEKTVIYSYPSSPMAEAIGFGKEGCWVLKRGDEVCLVIADGKGASRRVFDKADSMPEAYSRWSMRPEGGVLRKLS